ncbi:hypothetical protein BDB01DRAFT_873936 [Pilobolus umbonatus]|nr:hypothetical protein BDB01DRAFT_873936 [Pilobolus umbonatus]
MKGISNFGVAKTYSFNKEDCHEHNLPLIFCTLQASEWLDEEIVAKKMVSVNVGTVIDAKVGLNTFIQGLLKIKNTQSIPVPVKEYGEYAVKYFKKPATKARFKSHFISDLDVYLLQKSKANAVQKMLHENYRIHTSLGTSTAVSIIEIATLTEEEELELYSSNTSCGSKNYHSRRKGIYSVSVLSDDEISEDDTSIRKLKEFRRRSMELTRDNVNQVSDLRLLTIYSVTIIQLRVTARITILGYKS